MAIERLHLKAEEQSRPGCPYRKLWAASLTQAARLASAYMDNPEKYSKAYRLYGYRGVPKRKHRSVDSYLTNPYFEAYEWWFEADPGIADEPGGFNWICHYVGLDPETLRRKILNPEWRHRVKHFGRVGKKSNNKSWRNGSLM